MSKLDELKQFVAQNFHEAKTPEEVEKQVKLNNLIEEANKESNDLLEANTKLSQAYREVIANTGGVKNNTPSSEEQRGIMPSFDEALLNFANGKDIYGRQENK